MSKLLESTVEAKAVYQYSCPYCKTKQPKALTEKQFNITVTMASCFNQDCNLLTRKKCFSCNELFMVKKPK